MEDMVNPFVYGSVVTGEDFVDREPELKDLEMCVRNGKSVVMYSNRRMGKSSLLAEFRRRRGKDFIFVYVDAYGVTDLNTFLERLVRGITQSSTGKAERLASYVFDTVRGLGFRVVLTGSGEVGVELISAKPRHHEIDKVFDLPEKVAKHKKKRMVVVFDEFQDIASVGGVPLIKTMRSKFQWHKNVAYVFSGSKRHMLMSIFEEYEGAFYKFARPMHLDPIPEDEFKKHLVRKYASAGGSLSAEVASKVVEAGVGYPYYIQHIAFELYQISLTPTFEDVESARLKTVEHQSHAFMNIWESVKSQLQRKYLLAVAKEPDAPQGFEFIERYGLRSPSHVSRIRKQLQKNGLIEKGRIVDPFFAHWLRSLEPDVTR
jgi:AAA+ ATPase superfamily predicted ATPase